MKKEFVKADTEIVINKRGQRAVSINGQDATLAPRLLNFAIDGLMNTFIMTDIAQRDDIVLEIKICSLVKDGYNILYDIHIDIVDYINNRSSGREYLEDIAADGNSELYPYIRGYLEGVIDGIEKECYPCD